MSLAINCSNNPRFDIVEFIKRLKKANFTQEQSELLAQETERVLEVVINNSKEVKAEIQQELHSDGLSTKKDLDIAKLELQKDLDIVKLELQKEIALIESRLLKWMLGVGITSTTVILGGVVIIKLMLHT